MGDIGPIKRIIEVLPEHEPVRTPAPAPSDPLGVPTEREKEPAA